jgi:hypothetical protein
VYPFTPKSRYSVWNVQDVETVILGNGWSAMENLIRSFVQVTSVVKRTSDLCRQAHRDQIEPTVDDLKLPRCVDCKQPAGYPVSVPLFCGLHRWCVICPKPKKEDGTRGERIDAQLHCNKDACTRRFDQLFPAPEQRYEAEQKYRAGTLKISKVQPQPPRTCVECQDATAIYPPESRIYCEVHQYCIICRTKVREILFHLSGANSTAQVRSVSVFGCKCCLENNRMFHIVGA